MLVAQKAQHHEPAFALGSHHGAEHFAAGEALAESAAQMQKKAVEPRVFQGVICLSDDGLGAQGGIIKPHTDAGEPFPIEGVGSVEHHTLAAGYGFVHQVHVAKLHVAPHLFVADVEHFDGFKKVVHKIAIKLALNPLDFIERKVGKTVHQIFANDSFAVAQHAVGDEIHHVGIEPNPPPWHPRQQMEHPRQGR